jgi:hypothetical protein
MDDLSELERLDRQRRQDAVAKIPVSFQLLCQKMAFNHHATLYHICVLT